ncbi:MAG TPA: hypothetical protein VKK79_17455 [Candidatus Lokiarchaeia archaeon]|nr:hypothetical protein [Candidatus Lokiarchaeia archaeon]
MSGFLYALDMFAQSEQHNPIKTMVLGDNRWTFSRIYGLDYLVLVVQTPIIEQNSYPFDDIKYSENLVKKVEHEFTSKFSADYFTNGTPDQRSFDDIKKWGFEFLHRQYDYLERREVGDPRWLANFDHADALVSAMLNYNPIIVLNKFAGESADSDDLERFRASLELISGDRVFDFKNVNPSQDPHFLENFSPDTFFLVNGVMTWDQEIQQVAIVDLAQETVNGGTEINSTARKLILYLQNNPFNEKQVITILTAKEVPLDPTETIMEVQGTTVEIQCKECASPLRFRTNDESTYLHRQVHEQFLGMNLITYDVAHIHLEEMHVNSVLIDSSGTFYGYVSTYAVPLKKPPTNLQSPEEFRIIQNNTPFSGSHRVLEAFWVMHEKNLWFYTILWPPSLNLDETKTRILNKLREIEDVYSNPPEFSQFLIADKNVYIWMRNGLAVGAIFHTGEFFEGFDLIAKEMVSRPINPEYLVSSEDRLNLAIFYLNDDRFAKTDAHLIDHLLFDDLFRLNVKVKFEDRIPHIVNRIAREFNTDSNQLEAYLRGNITILDYLIQEKDLDQGRKFMEIVDFLQNRHLFD